MSLAVLQASVLDINGGVSVAPSAQIEVRTPAGALATLYTDRAGTTPTGANPIFADSKGFFRVYVAPGRYKVTVTTAAGVQVYEDLALFAEGVALGTAATANVTTSNIDTTAGRVLRVGDGGLLGIPVGAAADVVRPYSFLFSGNNPDLGVGNYAGLSVTRLVSPFRGFQIVADTLAEGPVQLYARKAISGVWQNTWQELYHTGSNTIAPTTGALTIGTNDATALIQKTNNVERSRTTATGNQLIGTTTDNGVDKLQVNGSVNATSYRVGAVAGASGTFTTADSKTVTVTNGLITSIV